MCGGGPHIVVPAAYRSEGYQDFFQAIGLLQAERLHPRTGATVVVSDTWRHPELLMDTSLDTDALREALKQG